MTTSVNVITNQGTPYVWDSATFQWQSAEGSKPWDGMYTNSYILNISETIAVSEFTKSNFKKMNKESITISERQFKLLIKNVSEAFNIAEAYVDYISYILRICETVNFSDATAKDINLPKKEAFSISEFKNRNIGIYQKEAININDVLTRNMLMLKKENIGTAELLSKLVSVLKKDNFTVTEDKFYKNINQVNNEYINIAEMYTDFINFMLRFIEHINLNETPMKAIGIPVDESFNITDKVKKIPVKAVSELLHISESEKHTAKFNRLIAEAIQVVDKATKKMNITHQEAIKVFESYIRNANAVLSDICFSQTDLTLEDFKNLDAPAGFSSFKDFAPGDLNYKKALIKTIIEAGVTTGRPQLTTWNLNIDVPDTWDRGTADIPAIRTRVDFNRRFFAPPEVSVIVRAGVNAIPYYDIDDTGFYVELKDINDTTKLVAGTISWQADGY